MRSILVRSTALLVVGTLAGCAGETPTSVTESQPPPLATQSDVIAAFREHGIALDVKQCKPGDDFVIGECAAASGIVMPGNESPTTTAALAPEAGTGEAFDVLVLDRDATALDPDPSPRPDAPAKALVTAGATWAFYRNNVLVTCNPACSEDAIAIEAALNDL